MKSLIPKTSVPSIIKHADGEFYTRYFSPIYDFLTRISGWQKKMSAHALEGIVPSKLLDVGCGTGYLLQMARSKKFEVTGLDASSGMLKQAQKKYNFTESMLVFGLANQMPFDDESFDVVIACGSLVHIPEIETSAQEMLRVVKKGGLIRIVDHAQPIKPRRLSFLFKIFSQLSGDILHDYDQHFLNHCQKGTHRTLGRGGYLQCMDYRRKR